MGPDTPHLFNDKLSEIEGSLDFSKLSDIRRGELKPRQDEVEELYKKNLIIGTEESQSEIDVENVYHPKRLKASAETTHLPKDIPILTTQKKVEDKRIIYECQCNLNDNFISDQCNPTKQQNRRISRLDRHSITKWFKNRSSNSRKDITQDKQLPEYYKMRMSEPEDDHSPPRRVIFSLIDELPKPKCTSKGVNTKPFILDHYLQSKDIKDQRNQRAKTCYDEKDGSVKEYTTMNRRNETIHHKIKCNCGAPTRVDVYYFDHGNASYLRTTDNPPLIKTEIIADQSEECNIKFWSEIFGTVHIGTSFVTSFILQLLRFLLQSIFRPMTIGLLQITSDYFFKPCLATLFNAVIQPPLICFYNVCTSLRDICDPIAEGFGYFIREIAVLFKSCRLVEIRNSRLCEKPCYQNNCSPIQP
ncbi:hypothetical protein HHI36_010912 [Cryptolaemus montrouzieri]